MQVNDACCLSSMVERKEKVATALAMLKSLKSRVSELRVQCEALKKLESEKQEDLKCSECGNLIEQDQEVTLRDSFGKVRACCHKDCFKEVWRSQNWKFDFSYPGFLRISGRDQ